MHFKLDIQSPLRMIFLGFGGLVMLIGLASSLGSAWFLARSVAVEGKVVAFVEHQKAAKRKAKDAEKSNAEVRAAPAADPAVAPVIEFTGPDGKPVRVTGSWFEREPTYALGDRVPLLHRPGDPEGAMVDIISEKWGFSLSFLALGGAFIMLALLMPGRRPQRIA